MASDENLFNISVNCGAGCQLEGQLHNLNGQQQGAESPLLSTK